ncbi:MAG TPA: PAS domain-containing protein [Candidatus Limnocylindria bacterium]|jgi:PAS domain-containing protein
MGSGTSERRRARPGRRVADLWLQLTPRQRRVLDLVAASASNKDIATVLGVSEQAAKQQVSKLLSRFGVESRTALAQSALAIRITGQRESDLPLEYLFDLAPVAMAMTSGPDHMFRAVNRTFTELFGDREGWIGYRLKELLTEPEAALLPLVDAVYRSGGGVQRVGVPVRLTGPDGPIERSLTITVEPTRNAAGAVGGLVFFGVDVTEEIALRARLQAAEDQQHAIVQQLPGEVGVVVVNADGRVVMVTGPIRDMIGGSLEPDVPLARQTPRYGMRWADTGVPLGPTDSPSVRALAGEEVAADLVGRTLADGPEYRMHISARPIRDVHGGITGAVMVFERLTPL